MKKTGKYVAIAIGALIALVIVAIVALPFLIDVNQYKDQIARTVKEKTGRDLSIQGKIGLSVFPWLGVEFNKLSLSNAPGFGQEPFAAVDRAVIRVKLLPLLHKEIQAGKVVLTGLQLNLRKDAAGKTNWDDLTKPSAATAAPKDTASGNAENTNAASPLAALSVEGLEVAHSELHWRDAVAGSDYTLRNIEIKSGALQSARPAEVQIGFDLESKPSTVSSVGGKKTTNATPIRTRVQLKTNLMVDVDKQLLDVSGLNLQLAGMTLTGNAKGQSILTKPQFSGHIDLAPFNLRDLLAKLGTSIDTQDKNALHAAALQTGFAVSGDAVSLTDLHATLDDTKLSGRFDLQNFTRPAYRFDIAIDQIDADRYLAPPTPTPTPATGTTPPAAATPDPAANEQKTVIAIPIDAIRALDADGTLRIQKLKMLNIKASDVSATLKGKGGLVQLEPTHAKLYEGEYRGGMSYDARGKSPTLSINENLKGVQLGAFLQDAKGFNQFVGKGNADIKVTAHGMSAQDISATLNGSAGFNIQNGILKGIDVRKMGHEIDDAAHNLRDTLKQGNVQALESLAPKPTDETKFDALRATTQIKNGVAFNDDLDLQGAGLKVTGKGSANLAASTVDYVANVNGFPIKITGAFSALKYRPDTNAILKSATDRRLQQEKEKLQQRIDQQQGDVKQKLNQRLQDYLKRH